MRIATSALLAGAASAAIFQNDGQHVISDSGSGSEPASTASSWLPHLDALEKVWGNMTSETKALWDEIALLVPGAFDQIHQLPALSKPKKHTRQPDSTWDHVVKGADVQAIWTKEADSEPHRHVGGQLDNYNLRVKDVDPSALKVDTVKQKSGYLDLEEEDKHFFFCKLFSPPTPLV